ncbi:Heparan sulfate 2-O-sulfotransferase 1 [Holothuria leucospilota]|uniref:Heparan sulfate 2-O-sulfotransferase 1 n=1 Tax=Holothuria leucospilota TaxID=206669 RepID=A0A9Q0YQG5_HOLLE|nr:Heparan sulfate 2-O-sulfotransferase 1 [Holothuria leucospilota]
MENMFGNFGNIERNSQNTVRTGTGILNLKAILTTNRSKSLDNLTDSKALGSFEETQLATERYEHSRDGELLGIVNMTANTTVREEVVIQGKSSDIVFTKETDYKQCNSSLDPSCMFGKCITGTNHILFYNRVPKCGSRTFLFLAKVLASKNSFHKPREATNSVKKKRKDSNPVDGAALKTTLRRRLMNMPLGSFLHGHIKYIDFKNDTRLPEKKQPIYLNIIRDPIDRLVSQYYFVRYGDRLFTNKRRLRKLQKNIFLNETLNDCVERRRPECCGSNAQVQYFCGYHPDCQRREEAFQRAVRNLDYYLVVGITEEYEDFLKVLEKLLPDYFKGVVDEYNTPAETNRKTQSSARKKQPLTEAVRDKLRSLLDMEYKFYYHVRSKFQGLKQELGIG